MHITTKSRYALRAALAIARAQEATGKPVRRQEIGGSPGFSPDYLEQLLVRLREAGIVGAVRGPGGGYRLRKAPAAISVWDVIDAVEDRVDAVPCMGDDRPECDRYDTCDCRPVWRHLKNVIQKELMSISLADVLAGALPLAGDEIVKLDLADRPEKKTHRKPGRPCA